MLTIIKHPLIETKLSIMRDEKTSTKDFRELVNEIATMMYYEVYKDLTTHVSNETYRTPTGSVLNKIEIEEEIIIAPILRAGLGFCDGIKAIMPQVKIGHIGMYRNEETLQPVEYYFKMPEAENPLIVIVDPMLATGGSAVAAIDACKKRGYKNIKLMCLVGVEQGIKAVSSKHPDVHIFLASQDEKLNDKGYIIPGLGDAGDRIFGTK